MGDDWRAVWERRQVRADTRLALKELIDLDGFDNAAGAISEADWLEYGRRVARELGVVEGQAIYEVGCGSGAFLFALDRAVPIKTAGCDYSSSLIDVIGRVLPDGDFSVIEADWLPRSPTFDHVVANSVFYYFPDLDYAERVLDRMLIKGTRTVAVLEVPNSELRDEAEAFRQKRFGPDVYAERYATLGHQYFVPDWFVTIAERRGVACEIVPSMIPNYDQGVYRFGSVFRLRE